MRLSEKRMEYLFNNRLNHFQYLESFPAEKFREGISNCRWGDLTEEERRIFREIIQEKVGVRMNDDNNYPEHLFEISFFLECNEDGKREIYDDLRRYFKSKNWAIKNLMINDKYKHS